MAELPIDLQRLETVNGALDIIRYLAEHGAQDGDDIAEDLGLSARGFDKAKRRLVTVGYITMRSDYIYELTTQGEESAQVLAEYDAAGGADDDSNGLLREAVIVLPRNLVYGQTSPMKVGLAPSPNFAGEANLVVRFSTMYADLGDWNEMINVDGDTFVAETTISPQAYTQARIKMEVYQLTSGGDGLSQCGGMYVDITVLEAGDTGEAIAYSTELEFVQ